ncbi:D-2-hydroxyacid dehydrogenase [Mycolicibacterium sp.]|uniref:D-2-hydroxyacid dehydrogenase n=1 Tax=Mycolicibacterium sp. TaxID=2320850 RepID=UPI003D0F02CD
MASEETQLVVLPPQTELSRRWARRLAGEVPEVSVVVADDPDAAAEALAAGATAAFGTLEPQVLPHARHLRWLQSPMAAPPPGYFYPALAEHPVVVTNLRGTYHDHVATHAVAMLLSLARNLHRYRSFQAEHRWQQLRDPDGILHLPESTILVVGLGAIGTEIVRLLTPFGATVLGTDARLAAPPPGVDDFGGPEALDHFLPTADAVILTVPHTPQTENLIDHRRLGLMKPGAVLINIGRGPVVDLDAVDRALSDNRIRGAAFDVYPTEPLPAGHPLWDRPTVILTPHVAAVGPYTEDRRFGVFRDNTRRFLTGRPLVNVVDKTAWF